MEANWRLYIKVAWAIARLAIWIANQVVILTKLVKNGILALRARGEPDQPQNIKEE
jgi:hypothetical protein